MQAYHNDNRIVLTLDAGGTNFVFSAVQGCEEITDSICYSSSADDLDGCLDMISNGFEEILNWLTAEPVAISLSFPGPADYDKGIIRNLPNFPAFQDPIPLGPMLEEQFELPVFINNDGALFALGEAVSGFLPWVNNLLKDEGIDQQYRNLIGATIGTGFGGGLVINGELCKGDNTAAGGMWLLRSRLNPKMCAEEGASIRAVKRNYIEHAGLLKTDPNISPKEIFQIGMGEREGNQEAAKKAFQLLGKEVGNALANAVTLIDGLIVIGGGLSGAHELFFPTMIEEMNGEFETPSGENLSRLATRAYNLEEDLNGFLRQEGNNAAVPGSDRKVTYNPKNKIGIGISHLGTNKAASIGAYHIALSALDKKNEQEKLLKY